MVFVVAIAIVCQVIDTIVKQVEKKKQAENQKQDEN
jgi:hypothetical protein